MDRSCSSPILLRALALFAAAAISACSDEEAPLAPESTANGPAAAVLEAGTPANGRIVYSAEVDGDREIFSVNPDGTDARRLTFSPGPDYLPAVSPDGRRIAFTRDRGGVTDIYVMNADGSRPRRLTAFGPAGHALAPTWSPDGKRIAFHGSDNTFDDDLDLFVINANGRGLRRILGGPDESLNDYGPAWSPDGQKIAFTRNDFNIFTVNVDGSGVEQFSQCGAHPCLSHAWSPDGSRIAYEVALSGGIGALEVKAFHQPAATLPVNLAGGRGGPAWAPDGTKLVYPATEDGLHSQLFTINADGTGVQSLAPGTTADQEPSWGRQR